MNTAIQSVSPLKAFPARSLSTRSVSIKKVGSKVIKAKSVRKFIDNQDTLAVYLKRLGSTNKLSATEEIELLRAVHLGDEQARKILIEANLRQVVKIAAFYRGKGIEFIDLIQEGNIGLYDATQRFSATHGCRFSTYAYWRIRAAITRSLSNRSRAVRLPVQLVELITKIHGARERLSKHLDRAPSQADLAKHIGTSQKRIDLALEFDCPTVSLDTPEEKDRESINTFEMSVVDNSAEERISQEELRAGVQRLLKTLSDQERNVVSLRFGLGDEEPCGLTEVGNKLGMTRNQVGIRSCVAMRKLKNAVKAEKEYLLSYLS